MRKKLMAIGVAAALMAVASHANADSGSSFQQILNETRNDIFAGNGIDFSETFSFNLTKATTSSPATATLFFYGLSAASLPGVTFQLDGGTAQLGTGVLSSDKTAVSYGYALGALSSGNHTLVVSGSDPDWVLGSSLTMQISAAPVPEPESYAMLLAGLGIMGSIVRRRKVVA